MKVSLGICAYNEEKNIGKLLRAIENEPLLNEVIVIASGCTDKTVEIAWSFPVRVIEEPVRKGKVSAVNRFIQEANGDILILESADTLPTNFTFKYLLEPFEDESVGMTGGHPTPIDSLDTNYGKITHLLWRMHHELALINPKAGELCAWRNVVEEIDPSILPDESSLEHEITKQGLKVVYVPEAIVFNKGCENKEDFMKQRERIYLAHLELKDKGYCISTMSKKLLAQTALRIGLKDVKTMVHLTYLELQARSNATKKYMEGNYVTNWDMSNSTKELA